MAELSHRVALIDDGGRLLRGPLQTEDSWPSPSELRATVDAADAVEIVPAWQDVDGSAIHLLATPSVRGDGEAWPPARGALARREAGGDGWPAWYLPGWRDSVDAWVIGILAAHGLRAAGPAEIVTWWSLSAVLRMPVANTAGAVRDVWFKATCEGFHDEAAITSALAGHPGTPIPGVLGAAPDRAWLLLEDVPGAGDEPPLDTVLAAARAMAELQIRLAGRERPLGVPLRDADATVAGLHTVVRDSIERTLMSSELRAAAIEAEPRLVASVHALQGVGLPLTLVHGDLHTKNLAGTPERPVIFDWTDACIAHPYLDGRLLANSAVSRAADGADSAEIEAAVRDAFTGPWRTAYPDLDHDLAWELSREVEVIFQVVSYEGIVRAQAPGSRWELGGMITSKLARLTGEVPG